MKLTDIARLAGVSVTTASYVVNGQAERRRISPATVERVMAVVREQRFQPDQQAAGLRRGQTRTLGLIIPDLENPSYARLAKLLEQRARQQGYQLLITSSDDDPDSERQVLAVLRSRRCDALVVASCLPADDATYPDLLASGTPVIGVDRTLDPVRFCSVVSDDRLAARQLTHSLLEPPPRHIALLGARSELPISTERERGFDEALAGFAGRVSLLQAPQFSRDGGRALMRRLLEEDMPDALLTTAYVLLEGVFDALGERHRLWPPGLRLGTFGDSPLLDFLPLPVNAISQQHGELADRVLQAALAAVERDDYQPGVQAVARVLNRRHGGEPQG
ncbi:catabolite repressor/activator [Stutzerimonas tarimensis]|uniref:Catabolite repressor/activator n=1 Tax=Stutzerimonas tarimensis TaxID=1507735 RepID=A0ABV7T9U3_9GAMM